MDEYLSKPLNPKQLFALIDSLTGTLSTIPDGVIPPPAEAA
jgi:hypothetical protein